MRTSLQSNGDLLLIDDQGKRSILGPEHPDYRRYRAGLSLTRRVNPWKARLIGVAMMVGGPAIFYMNLHRLATESRYSVKSTIAAPMLLLFGIVALVQPQWLAQNKPAPGKVEGYTMLAATVLMVLLIAASFYYFQHYSS